MDLVHIHLLLNHVPVIGLIIGFLILAWGMIRRYSEVTDAGLMVLFITSLVAIPVYLTGEPAEEAVEKLAGVSDQIIELHEDAAVFSLALCIAVGAVAFITLIAKRYLSGTPAMIGTFLVLALTAVAGASIAYTSNLGGQVRHSEIRFAQSNTSRTDAPAVEKKKEKDDDDD